MSDAPVVDGRRTDTRDRLVVAALSLFAERGYDGTTVAEIERACGLRPGGGAMYRHFSSKEELLLAAVTAYRERVASLRAELATLEPAPDAATDLERIVGALAGFLRGEQPIVQLGAVGGSLPDPVRQVIAEAWDEGYGIVVDLIRRRGADVDDPEAVAVEAVGALDHYASHLAVWRHAPLGVGMDRFLAQWVRRWAAVLGDPPPPPRGGRRRTADRP